MTLRSKIPSANSLFVFEAVARLRSFTRAASEFNVTQPAISRTIAALEKHVGEKLFRRAGRQLELTTSGDIMFAALGRGFSLVEGALDEIALQREGQETVTLSISTAMASHWLIPRFDDFRTAFPTTELRFHLMSGEPTGPVAPCDLGLRLGDHGDTEHARWSFAPERVFALASPEYLAKRGFFDDPGLTTDHILIQLSKPRLSWHEFAGQTEQLLPGRFDTITVPDYSVVLQSAINSKGIALGFVSVASKLICDGFLELAGHKYLDTGRRYHLVAPKRHKMRPIVEQVRDWMISEMERDIAKIEDMELS